MSQEPFATAYKLHTLGFSVIPSGGGPKGKTPLVDWKAWQSAAPDEVQFHAWNEELQPELWGIVTNEHAGVLDVDTPEARVQLEAELGEPHVITPRGGAHWYVDTTGHPLKTVARLLPGIDVRGVGGFVNIAGGKYEIIRLPVPADNLIPWASLPERIREAMNGSERRKAKPIPEIIPEGQRDAILASLGGSMRDRGASQQAIEAALLVENNRCQTPLPEKQITKIAKSMASYPPHGTNIRISPLDSDSASERVKSVSESVSSQGENDSGVSRATVEEWVRDSSGWFSYEELDRELNIKAPDDKTRRRVIIKRLRDEGMLEGHPRDNKLLRHKNIETRVIDFKAAGKRTPLAVRYPFGIERYFKTYPGNIIALAGAADAGKTAFLLNFIRLNMYDFSIYYQSSEMGPEELASRLENFEGINLEDWNFEAEQRSRDFADVVRPDCVNIIDYLELAGDFYAVADYMRQIHDRLAGGIALVALQKKRDAELGRGGDFGLEKPRLYLSMDAGKLTIQKCKNWASHDENPNGLKLEFKTVAGCRFTTTRSWYED